MLFLDSKNLNKLIKKNKNIKWSKKIKKLKDLNNFYRININISKSKIFIGKIKNYKFDYNFFFCPTIKF